MNSEQMRKVRGYIDWMRTKKTLSLQAYFDMTP